MRRQALEKGRFERKVVEIKGPNRFSRESSFLFYVPVDQLPFKQQIAFFAESWFSPEVLLPGGPLLMRAEGRRVLHRFRCEPAT
jgi:hypothetical protein